MFCMGLIFQMREPTKAHFMPKEKFILNTIYLFILVQPLIDLVTSLNMTFFPSKITVGVALRILFMTYVVAVSVFFTPSGSKKQMVLAYYFAFAVFSLAFLLLNFKNKGMYALLLEIKGLAKSFYFPLVIVALYMLKDEISLRISPRLMAITLSGYSFIIFIATLSGTYFYSYGPNNYPYNTGSTGWFFAANETGTILAILLPFAFLYSLSLSKKEKKKNLLFGLFSIFALIFSILVIATKTPFLSVTAYIFVFSVLFFIYYLLKHKHRRKYVSKILSLGLVVVISASVFVYTPANKTVGVSIGRIAGALVGPDNNGKDPDNPEHEKKPSEEVKDLALSSRDAYFAFQKDRFESLSKPVKLVGLGYALVDKSGNISEFSVEQDFADLFFYHGYLGFLIWLLPLALFLAFVMYEFSKRSRQALMSENFCTGLFAVALSLGIAALSGHTLVAPAVGIHVILAIIFTLQSLEEIGADRVAEGAGDQNA